MISLFTDFGSSGPYVGQLHRVLALKAPGVPVIDLFHDVPNHDILAGAYLLPAYSRDFPPGSIHVCVVDPGVGGVRRPVALQADSRWYLGPDNGLLSVVARRARQALWHELLWRPSSLSATFQARDLFAPVAAMLAIGQQPEMRATTPLIGADWPEDLATILYIDRYGNAITGLRAQGISRQARLRVGGHGVSYAETYSSVPEGSAFWTENSNGLVEIAVNRGMASELHSLTPGTAVEIV